MKILFVGDVYGERGFEAMEKFLPSIKQTHKYHMLIVNGENAASGLGLREEDYKRFMRLGVHGITLGNHSFSKQDLFNFIDESNIVRPANYPKSTPGKTVLLLDFNGHKVALINLMGQVFMGDPLNSPFETIDQLLENLEADTIIVDMHAEATSEKLAMGHYLDGRVTAVLGTHTHVPTADAMTLPKGTLYITDVGMTGTKFGILGADKELVLEKFLTKRPVRLKPSKDTALQLNAVLIDTASKTIKRINKID